jgi:phage-related holin
MTSLLLITKKIWAAILVPFAQLEYGTWFDKIQASITLTLLSSPVIWVLSALGTYVFPDRKFIGVLFVLFMADIATGIVKHWMAHTFSFKELYTHLLLKLFVTIVGMALFNTLALVDSGDDAKVIVDYFKLAGKVFNAFYVGGSAFSNLFIITGGKFPPVGFMKRTKKFNDTGNIADLTNDITDVSQEKKDI